MRMQKSEDSSRLVRDNRMEIFSISVQAVLSQLLLGLINGAFYAVLSLGLAIIWGIVRVMNFTQGAQYMMGAFAAWMLGHYLGIGYWVALLLSPLIVGLIGVLLERLFIRRLYDLDHLYAMLLTFGLSILIEGIFRHFYGSSGQQYSIPPLLVGRMNLGFMVLPYYRAWVIAVSIIVCGTTWFVIERTKVGSYLRAAAENPTLLQAFGVNVPLLLALTYGASVALAAFAGVLAAPIYQVGALMGSNVIVVIFAVVIVGGMGSIGGSILSGFMLGLIEGVTKVFYAPASSTVIFVVMVLVQMFRPAGLFGRES